ncbi:tRNA pseudouridine55 synthase [Oikeobacillus pervagus]|uniref:tRNA pseudouridine synthase B n=1 Tax=Oikeobacillus pervagus TaxID=1325931 RepID=A0AAJ1SZT9_9BACI|nr:tRNA pseudouridine(55) synthase TruB [Oikeobacillus pervagus]MDQ0214256.1 tRNA pseudouridine55 synthase [Oikeobacillus pervagus]
MNGIIPLWKEKGMTSHDCVYRVRKILKTKKVGHTGTLDPDVTGVLPICVGRATKIAEYITNAGKTYVGRVTLGYSTTTEDASGEILEKKNVDRWITPQELEQVFQKLTGEIEQTPPMFSAVKVNGKRLYEYAREGIEVERPTRKVKITSIELLSLEEQQEETMSFTFRVVCSKGTYIRTLAVMMGELLGYPAHMSELTRTSSGSFTEDDCYTLGELEERMNENKIHEVLRPIMEGVSSLPKWPINDTLAMKVKNGAVLAKPNDWPDEEHVALIENDSLLAIYQTHPSKQQFIKPVKVIAE